MRIGATVLLLLLAACGEPETSSPTLLSTLPTRAGPLDALNRRHARLRERMRTRGYGEELGLAQIGRAHV